jgi:hypothetical protein
VGFARWDFGPVVVVVLAFLRRLRSAMESRDCGGLASSDSDTPASSAVAVAVRFLGAMPCYTQEGQVVQVARREKSHAGVSSGFGHSCPPHSDTTCTTHGALHQRVHQCRRGRRKGTSGIISWRRTLRVHCAGEGCHSTGRERMGSPTLQTLQDQSCFCVGLLRGGGFPNPKPLLLEAEATHAADESLHGHGLNGVMRLHPHAHYTRDVCVATRVRQPERHPASS